MIENKINSCELKFYKGSFSEFAIELLTKGRGNGSVCRMCEIPLTIANDMKANGVPLLVRDVVVTQRQVFKYRKHPKTRKGANLPVEDYALVEKALRQPTNIFEDTVQKRLVYLCAHPYHDSRMIKVVVEPNFKNHGAVINLVKSWGIVEPSKMKSLQYRQIQ